jgi:hypothetical protein
MSPPSGYLGVITAYGLAIRIPRVTSYSPGAGVRDSAAQESSTGRQKYRGRVAQLSPGFYSAA